MAKAMGGARDFVHKLHRAFPLVNIEVADSGCLRANGRSIRVRPSDSPGYWRCVRKCIRRMMERRPEGETEFGQ